MKKPENLTSTPLPWGQNAELEFTSPAVTLFLLPLAEGESPRVEAGPEVQLEVKESGRLTRVTVTATLERFGLWRSLPQVWLHLPRDVHARVSTDAGTLMAQGFAQCELQMSAAAGVIDLRDVHGRLSLRASAGTIRGSRVGGVLDVETGAGSVRLDVDALEAGTHRVRSSMGSVRVLLAAGLDVKLETQTTLGSVRTRYPSRSEAAVVLRLETELGSVRVRESEPGRDEAGSERGGRGRGRRERGMHEHGMHERGMHERGMHEHGPWMNELWMMHRARRHAFLRHPFSSPPPGPQAPEPAARSATAGVADEELRRILTLVQEQKLTAAQAELLLRAMDQR